MRSVVKHSYLTSFNSGRERARAHVRYIKYRPGKDKDAEERSFFDEKKDEAKTKDVFEAVDRQGTRGVLVHKLILSPGVEDADTRQYTREVMKELGRNKGLDLEWYAVQHDNTDHPHCHIVLMAKDKSGRQVRLERQDHQFIRATGDKYLERNKLLDKKPDKAPAKKSRPGRLLEKVKLVAHHFDTKSHESEAENKQAFFSRFEADEQNAFGAMPSEDVMLMRQLAKDEKRIEAKERAWKKYCQPLQVDYSDEDATIEPAIFTRNCSSKSLKALSKDFEDGDYYTRRSISEEEHERLQYWIKDRVLAEKRFEQKVKAIVEIPVAKEDEETVQHLTARTSAERLKDAREAHLSGKCVLDDYQYSALSGWIKAQEESKTKQSKERERVKD